MGTQPEMIEKGEVAVFALPDPKWVEAVTAVVVPKSGSSVTVEEIREHAHQHLAGFKVPKNIFVTDGLPKNPSGKILKRTLREEYSLERTGGVA